MMDDSVVHIKESDCDSVTGKAQDKIQNYEEQGYELVDTELDTYYDQSAARGYSNILLIFKKTDS